jgi:hypothetical protein
MDTQMKWWKFHTMSFLMLAVVFGTAGCVTTNPNVTKERGVYTTVAMEGENLDMPAVGYTSYKTFGPSQTPAAVVVGYGFDDGPNNNRSQEFDLQVVETDNGAVIQNSSGSAFAGKAAVINLPIRKSGNYRLKLLINNSVYDTWDFTINREAPADTGSTAVLPPTYAKGMFSTSIEEIPDAFSQYDEYLLQAMNDAVEKQMASANHDDFAQTPPGHVLIQFDLSETGHVSLPRIIQNSLGDALGNFFLHALQSGSPYKAWPDTARAVAGTNSVTIKVNFSYN